MRLTPEHRGGHLLNLDLTPMVDVVFLLIVFFMTTAQFARLTRTQVELPEQLGEKNVEETSGLVINVTRFGGIIVDQREVSFRELLGMVNSEISKASGDAASVQLWIRADQSAPASVINDIALGVTDLGVKSWRLATEAPAPGAAGGA